MKPRLFLILIALLAVGRPAWAEVGRIKQASGAAWVERGGQRLSSAPGLVLEAGDMLVTGRDGRMSLTFTDSTRFAIGPGSRIAVARFDYDGTTQRGAFETRVDRGSLAVISGQIAKSRRDAMRVRTPTSLLGIRGTRFIVEVR